MKHLLPTVVVIFIASTIAAQTPAPSWSQWRGPARDGVASSFTAPATWPAQLTKKWEATVGAGHASPVIAGSRIIVHSVRSRIGKAAVAGRRRCAVHHE